MIEAALHQVRLVQMTLLEDKSKAYSSMQMGHN